MRPELITKFYNSNEVNNHFADFFLWTLKHFIDKSKIENIDSYNSTNGLSDFCDSKYVNDGI